MWVCYDMGVALLIIGKIMVDNDGTETLFLQVGSVLVIVSTATMLWLFATKSEGKTA
jgi:hypothetical protein